MIVGRGIYGKVACSKSLVAMEPSPELLYAPSTMLYNYNSENMSKTMLREKVSRKR